MSKPNFPDSVDIAVRGLFSGRWETKQVPGRMLPGGRFAATLNNGRIGLTHVKTGFLVVDGIKSYTSARETARKLRAVPVDWDFSDPSAVAYFSKKSLARIHAIRKAAVK